MTDYRSLSGEELFELVKTGDDKAWDEIVYRREQRIDQSMYKLTVIG